LHRSVTVPQLTSVIAFYVVVEAITMVSWVFNYVYVISQGTGGPGDATQVTELYVYQSAFQYSAPDLAAAAAVILFGATLLFIVAWRGTQGRAGLSGGTEWGARQPGQAPRARPGVVRGALPCLRDDPRRVQDAGRLPRQPVVGAAAPDALRLPRGRQ